MPTTYNFQVISCYARDIYFLDKRELETRKDRDVVTERAERQRNRETEKQRNRETEKQRGSETERHRVGITLITAENIYPCGCGAIYTRETAHLKLIAPV